MKKILYIVGIASLMLFNTAVVNASNEVYYTNRENIEMTEEEYNNLLGLAFSEEQIERMDLEEFLANKDLHGEIIGTEEKLIETTVTIQNGIKTYSNRVISEDEYLQNASMQIQQPTYSPNVSGYFYDGLSWTTVRALESFIVSVNDDYMRYKADLKWLQVPSDRYYDIIGVGIEPSKVEIASSIVFREDYKTTSSEYGYTKSCSPKSSSTGASVIFQLPSGAMEWIEAYTYFNVTKVNQSSTITSLEAIGDYAHGYNSVNSTGLYNNHSIDHVGGLLILSPYNSSYDNTITANASFVATW